MLGAHGGLSTGCHPGPIPPCDSVLKAQGGGSGPCSRPRKAVPPAGVSLASGLRRPEAPSQRQNRHRVGPARGGFFLGPQLGHATAWAGVPAMGGPALPYPGLGCPCYCLCVEATRSGVFQQGPHLSGVWPSPHSPHPGQSWGHGLSKGCSGRARVPHVCACQAAAASVPSESSYESEAGLDLALGGRSWLGPPCLPRPLTPRFQM